MRAFLLVHDDREYVRRPGEELQTDLGVLDVPEDVTPGDVLETHLGEPFTVRELRGPDLFEHFERTGAPMMPRDIGLVMGHTGASGGDRVLDAGTGTGVLSAYLARAGADVTTYETDADFADVARGNMELAGVEEHVDVRAGDVTEALDELAAGDGFDVVTLDTGDTRASTTVVVEMPTAGRLQFPEPNWRLTDSHAAFTESVDRGPTPTVTVEAHTLENLHVGQGGTELSAFGQHATDGTGDGITPAELRQYLPGDPADQIDWKATARLAEPYVREFEAESDREITLLVDHRAKTASGSLRDSQLEYLRAVALGVVGAAESASDPLGLLTVGDAGLTNTVNATSQQTGYSRIRDRLLTLEPTPAGPPRSPVDLQHPAAARQLTRQLADDEGRFATVLRQFTETATAYVERIETDPLYGAVEYLRSMSTATQLTVIFTTDTDRSQLRETVRAAASGDSAVLVFLTPAVLFEASGVIDLEAAYRRYREFEEFRSELEGIGAVSAYEVGPGDRLARLLSSNGSRQAGRRATPGGTR